jgi:Domain of unknown function (DUF4349)
MPSPDVIAPERLEKLLRGAPPEGEREARLQGLLRELRSNATPAPQTLCEHARALREPAPRRLPRVTRRRAALVLAPAVVAVAAAALGATTLLGDDSAPEQRAFDHGSVVGERGAIRSVPPPLRAHLRRTFQATGAAEPTPGRALDATPSPAPSSGRARDIDMWIELRLPDADRLSDAANAAMEATRELGGFVASSTVGMQAEEGRAQLRLRVPIGRVEDAVFRLSQLGTITGQRVATDDLQTEIDSRSRRIAGLRSAIRIAELTLRSGSLDAEERLELEIKLERWRSLLAEARRTKARFLREAATAELTLVLHTRAAAAAAKDESRVEGAARDALDFLARTGSVALFLGIVLSPLLLLAVLLGLALRSRTRRIEERLLERPRPAAPSPQPPPS